MKTSKNLIIKKIKETYCRLKISKIEGIGVFSIRNIPKGTNPFKGIFEQRWQRINIKDFGVLDKEVLKMVEDFFVVEKDQTINVPEYGLNGMDISFFLNNSDKPNLITKDGHFFVTKREVKKGEELSVAYKDYDYKYKK